ncbi:MAG TPA: GNAT family N-acetyltransferase [Anaerolineae bacterium]|nr:GNAT family N-acetyltransferase [Anaerolineae bacterium]
MNLVIRPFSPDDYAAITEVSNAAFPEYSRSIAERRYWDEHQDPRCKFQRWVALRADRVIGLGEYSQPPFMYHPRKFYVHAVVHPAQRRQGVGRALYTQLLAALQAFDPLLLRSEAREDMTDSRHFLEHRDFREDMRAWESRLDVAAFDFTPYAGVEERVCAQGIALKTLAELAADPDRNRKLYEMFMEVEPDVPAPDAHTAVDYDHFIERTLGNPNLLPDAFFIAVHNGAYVGSSALWASQGNADLYTGLTGVKRAYRRKGIALAMKLRGIDYARTHGRKLIKTWNESNNRPMLSINEALGYVKQPAWITFVKVLKEE